MAIKDRNEEIETIKKDIKIDANKASNLSRFGYFSIIYPAFLGDQYYSLSKKSTNIIKIEHTNSQNQVITGPRNVSSNPTKTDKYPTSFFTNSYQEHPKRIIELKEAEDRYQKDKLNKVRFRKSEEYKKQVHFRPNFKPSGPTEYID